MLASSFSNGLAHAHWDTPPQGSAYHTTVTLEQIQFNEGSTTWNDLLTADLVIGWNVELTGHSDSVSGDVMAFTDVSISENTYLEIGKEVISHDECSPLGDIKIKLWAAESDQDNLSDTAKHINQRVHSDDSSSYADITLQDILSEQGDEWIGTSSRTIPGSHAEGFAIYEYELNAKIGSDESISGVFVIKRTQTYENNDNCLVQEDETVSLIPAWFKNNARWWQEGIISDTEIVNALESLLIQDVIPLDKFIESHPGLEHEAGVEKGGTFEITPEFPSHPGLEHEAGVQPGGTFVTIPEYQKTVFGYWSEGLVSDGEIVNSIGHLMSTGIISSEKIKEKVQEKVEEKTRDEFGRPESGPARDSNAGTFHISDSGVIFSIYETQKLNELSFNLLLDVKNAESALLKKASVIAWDDYADEQTSEKATRAQSIEKLSGKTTNDALFVTKQLSKLKNEMEQTKTYAKTLNFNLEQFDQIDYEIDARIDNLPKMSSIESIQSGAKELQKIQKETNSSMRESLSLLFTDTLSKYLKNSEDTNKLENSLNASLSDVTFSKIGDVDMLSDIIGPSTGELNFEDDFDFVLIHPTDNDEELPNSAGFLSSVIFFETIFGINDLSFLDVESEQQINILEKEDDPSYVNIHEQIDEIVDEVDSVAEQIQPIVVLIGDGFANEYSVFSAPEVSESEEHESTEPNDSDTPEESEPVDDSQTSDNTGDISIKVLIVQGVYAPIVQFSIQPAGYCPESYSPYFGAILDVNGDFVDLDASQHTGATPICQTISTSYHSISNFYVTQEQIDNFISETNYYGIPMDPRDGQFYGQ
ncbi:Zn-dependent protease [Candidatus Nitrosopumilus sp. SW]|nr:Zn-dependent protease [Candidatus Nitrosopumilus sp. SW]